MTDGGEIDARARARIGEVLKDKYRLDEVIGVGGMAVVYRATHRNKAEFALKMLHPELCARPNVRARFLREGYVANSVKHPGLVRVVDDDVTEDGAAFLVMDLLDGMSADHLVGQKGGEPGALAVALAIGVQLLDALAAAHAAGIVHRDIKPANLFLTRDGTVKVLDFGIALVFDDTLDGTQFGGGAVPLGTPAFMAPEQAQSRSAEIDAQTDVWAAGATLFALITGEAVHKSQVAAQALATAASTPARSLATAAPDVPAPIASVVDRALSFEKGARWASADAMRDALLAACAASAIDPPDKAALVALFPARATGDRISALLPYEPTVASGPALPRLDTTGPRATEPLPRPRARPVVAERLALAAVALFFGAGLGVLAWKLRAKDTPPSAASASSAAAESLGSAASAAATGPYRGRGVSVLVLGIENGTADPIFDGTLDGILASAMSQSPLISPYALGALRSLAAELDVEPLHIDERLATKLFARDGARVVTIRGAVAPRGAGYALSITARDTRGGDVFFTLARDADGAHVASELGKMACELRRALGEATPDDPRRCEQTKMSASLEADHELIVGDGLHSTGKYEEALGYLRRAVTVDPRFARAHEALGNSLWNLGRRTEAEHELELAVRTSDEWGELDRLELQGGYYQTVGAYGRAVLAYEELLAKRPGELFAETALTEAYWETNQMTRALELARRTSLDHPRKVIPWVNLACAELRVAHLDEAAEQAARVLASFPRPPPHTFVYLALSAALLGDDTKAAEAYGKLRQQDASLGIHGLADLALAEGRASDAAALLEPGILDDLAAKNPDAVARKQVLLAEARLRQGNLPAALAAARAARVTADPATLYAAGEVEIEAGGAKGAQAIAADLGKSPAEDARLYAKVLEASSLRVQGKAKEALPRLAEALHFTDSWLARVGLARARIELGQYADAERELRTALDRRGEGALVFDPDAPTARFLPPLTYYLARALEGQSRREAKATYEAFLAHMARGERDPLVDDARRRLAGL
jgi:serine/threonine-protein kinase